MTKKREYEELMPIFQLVPQSDSRIKCKCVGTCQNDKLGELTDEIIETKSFFDSEKNDDSFDLGTINGYKLYGKYCTTNITGSYLVTNKKFPVFYYSVLYSRTFIGGCLCNATIFFTFDDESVKKLDNPKKYVGATITGKYTYELVFPEETDIFNSIRPIIEEEIMKKFVDKFNNEEAQQEIVDQISNESDEIISDLTNFANHAVIDYFPTKKNALLKSFRPFYKSDKFNDLMKYCLLYRDYERIKVKCPDMAYEAPKKYTSLKELSKNIEL
ncbi:hypothetical protein BMW23_0843 [Bodo saltans virus]|uniref:Uncharacterized protein n=1 Tax=Bodo saltans virus TaxID=2024608 RepID=A0A2H4UVK1_9VIRU|nr:hypothetical protein QJ851_gp0826 [Bodo saltans virus]ATZ80889.1 hypothetical protein BMW23_0843 [Bodo saltans virus]